MEGLNIDLESRPVWVVSIARAGSGKSTLTRAIFYAAAKKKIYKHIICFTGTAKSLNNEYDWLPDHAVREMKSPNDVFAIFDKLKRWKVKNPDKRIEPWALILEDVAGDGGTGAGAANLMYHPRFTHIVSCFRHYGCSIFCNFQYYSAMSPHTRSAIDYLAVFRTRSKAALRGLSAICDGHFESKKEFIQTLESATKEPYSCLWYDARAPTKAQAFQSFKATPPPDFKIEFKNPGL